MTFHTDFVEVREKPNIYKYKELPHNTLTTVWDPAANKYLHFRSVLVSVENAGTLTLYEDAATMAILHFNEKKTVPIPIGVDVTLAKNGIFKAKFVGDAATPSGHITVLGHEHS